VLAAAGGCQGEIAEQDIDHPPRRMTRPGKGLDPRQPFSPLSVHHPLFLPIYSEVERSRRRQVPSRRNSVRNPPFVAPAFRPAARLLMLAATALTSLGRPPCLSRGVVNKIVELRTGMGESHILDDELRGES